MRKGGNPNKSEKSVEKIRIHTIQLFCFGLVHFEWKITNLDFSGK